VEEQRIPGENEGRRTLKDAITHYCRTETRNLAQMVQNKLPAELRKVIYDELVEHNDAGDDDKYWAEELIYCLLSALPKDCSGQDCHCLEHEKLPLWLNKNVVGIGFAGEAYRVLFSKSMIAQMVYMGYQMSASEVQGTFLRDFLHVGIATSDILREADLKVSCYRRGTDLDATNFLENMRNLSLFPNKRGFKLKLHIRCSRVPVNMRWIEETMDVLQPIIDEFREAGAEVDDVLLKHKEHSWEISHTFRCEAAKLKITSIVGFLGICFKSPQHLHR
jgi:hypothetical protein